MKPNIFFACSAIAVGLSGLPCGARAQRLLRIGDAIKCMQIGILCSLFLYVISVTIRQTMAYGFDYMKFAQRIERELRTSDHRTGAISGEDITRIIKKACPGTSFASARVSEAKQGTAHQMSKHRIEEWVAFFQWRYPDEDWSVERFVEEFAVEGFNSTDARLKRLEKGVADLRAEFCELKQAIARSLVYSQNGHARQEPHPYAVALREKLFEVSGIDPSTEKGREIIESAVDQSIVIGPLDKDEIKRVLLSDAPAPQDIKNPWNKLISGLAQLFKELTGRTYTERAIASIMERRCEDVRVDPLAASE